MAGIFKGLTTGLNNRKIVLISSGQPSLGPRLVKEADALTDAGYDVTVIYAYWNSWGTQLDEELLPTKKWNAIRAGGDPKTKPLTYLYSRLLHKAASRLNNIFGAGTFAAAAIARSSYHLTREAEKHCADLYIGHNLGALPAVVNAATKHGKPCGFDAEDFHRYEESDDDNDDSVKLKTYIENKYLPKINYLTVSSPLIGEAYSKLYPGTRNATVLNTFTKTLTKGSPEKTVDGPIRLFWFSQTVGANRGIEDVIAAINKLSTYRFELHLLGDANAGIRDAFCAQFIHTESTIHFHRPIPSQQILAFAAQFDIGLAAEQKHPINRDICLTNKLFTYVQAGLALLVSDTSAQSSFMQENNIAGKLYPTRNTDAIADALRFYHSDRAALARDKKQNYELGQNTLNWDIEKEKFLKVISETLA